MSDPTDAPGPGPDNTTPCPGWLFIYMLFLSPTQKYEKLNFPECVKCYSCGYMKWDDSETQKLPGDVPFCNGQFQDVNFFF